MEFLDFEALDDILIIAGILIFGLTGNLLFGVILVGLGLLIMSGKGEIGGKKMEPLDKKNKRNYDPGDEFDTGDEVDDSDTSDDSGDDDGDDGGDD